MENHDEEKSCKCKCQDMAYHRRLLSGKLTGAEACKLIALGTLIGLIVMTTFALIVFGAGYYVYTLIHVPPLKLAGNAWGNMTIKLFGITYNLFPNISIDGEVIIG